MHVIASTMSFGELGPMQYAGFAAVLAGIAIEWLSEETRWAFKKDAKNKGKIDSTGES